MRMSTLYVLSTVLMTIIAIASAVLAVLANSPIGKELGLFHTTNKELSDKYHIEATPADWTFSIWGFIFLLEILWIVYALSALCRSTKQGQVYSVAPVLPPSFTLLFCVNQLLLIGWLFLFDREYLSYSSVDLLFIFVTGALCLVINYRLVEEYKSYMQENLMGDLVANRLLVQNGVAMYTTWILVATLLNSAITLTYRAMVDDALASTIMYILVILVSTLYFLLDVTIWEKYTRYTLTPYIVVIVASLGSLDFDYDPDSTSSISQLIAVILGCVFLIGKLLRTIIIAAR
ncbi:uncharacterized protein LOC117118106 [Anneissia japonica]|uniref:uncharacterized protein LOC117118106 n=1 Tax=Anneissia japonica TaxID=1529436 RepID=UPI001425670D|nr:uncharacterized protein LOC117118106 [Anneissia japonica]XP_033118495.1 uncharacterized protein LOC117118106 [Anneissia japonica]